MVAESVAYGSMYVNVGVAVEEGLDVMVDDGVKTPAV
jgi:hypothetical protein